MEGYIASEHLLKANIESEESTPAQPPEGRKQISIMPQAGDIAGSIAKKYDMTLEELQELN